LIFHYLNDVGKFYGTDHIADMRWSPAMRDFRDTLAHKHGNSVLRTLRGPSHAGDLITDQKLGRGHQ